MRVHELHAPVKVVQRAKGRSAVAAAAYRAGAELVDERTGIVHDYARKQGVEDDALLLPANAPEWAHDRAKLWNAAEAYEKHPRAQTARDLTVSFPSEFSRAQRQEAGLRIGQWIVARYGAAVDIAWHEPSRKGDQRNHHAHFLFTTRRFDERGQWAKTKDRTLDDLKKGPEEIAAMRLGVADALNDIAARDRLDVYIEHLSFEKRGLDQEATQHMGPIATGMERDGMETDIGNKNREIRKRNEERRKLQEERKVIDIETARERLKTRQEQASEKPVPPAPAAPEADAYEAFYRESQARRTALMDALEREHGPQEKRIIQDIALITGEMENAGFFSRIWRSVTGRARADRERIAQAARELEELQRHRQEAQRRFERERQARLEELKAERQRRELELEREAQAEALPMAVGEKIIAVDAPAPPPTNYEARRREYFRRVAAQRKGRIERESQEVREKPRSPAPDLDQPVKTRNVQAATTSPPSIVPEFGKSEGYAARREEFMRRRQKRSHIPERDDGPSREP